MILTERMTKASVAELLDLIIDRAPKLRAAGLCGEIEVEGLRFSLERATPEPGEPVEQAPDDMNPLYDKATFGLSQKTRLPGRRGS